MEIVINVHKGRKNCEQINQTFKKTVRNYIVLLYTNRQPNNLKETGDCDSFTSGKRHLCRLYATLTACVWASMIHQCERVHQLYVRVIPYALYVYMCKLALYIQTTHTEHVHHHMHTRMHTLNWNLTCSDNVAEVSDFPS